MPACGKYIGQDFAGPSGWALKQTTRGLRRCPSSSSIVSVEMLYDIFICHASEDKQSFVRPLAEALQKENVAVWYDDFSLKLGDSIRRALDRGLSQSRFGVIVLSRAFFQKKWPQYSLTPSPKER
jgi:hypothetical protein